MAKEKKLLINNKGITHHASMIYELKRGKETCGWRETARKERIYASAARIKGREDIKRIDMWQKKKNYL